MRLLDVEHFLCVRPWEEQELGGAGEFEKLGRFPVLIMCCWK